MADRDRLIEVFKEMDKNPEITCLYPSADGEACKGCKYGIGEWLCDIEARKADYLLASGVIVPPCKVGDTVFMIKDEKIYDGTVRFLRWESHKDRGVRSDMLANPTPYFAIGASFDDFGKTVFLTKEEAERALKERENND